MIRRIFLALTLCCTLLVPAHAVVAATTNPLIVKPSGVTCDSDNKNCQPDYTISDFFRQFVALAWWGLGLMALLSVGTLVWAGVLFITAAGNPGRIDEGKKIITGTITGILISLTSFVIINTVVGGLTGQQMKASDYFSGTISILFKGKTDTNSPGGQSIERPFAGVGTIDTDGSCQGSNTTTWNKECSADALHIFCADPKGGSTLIKDYQAALNELNCNCGSVDGCYGSKTLACVRNFQLQNNLVPTGEINSETRALLLFAMAGNSSTVKSCAASTLNPITTKLPAISNTPPSSASTTLGCCAIGTGDKLDYCADNVSQITCSSMSSYSFGSNGNFDAGTRCAASPSLKQVCGFCSDSTGRSFEYAGEHWCKEVAYQIINPGSGAIAAPLTFTAGTCHGRGMLNCYTQLLLTPR
jgi:peptidoglycan hydrolase-like protein with peptidoglycan-binding domain